jgi:hypothetical protein
MAYSIGPNGEARTPGGCRVDNGRCVQSIDWNYSKDYCRFVVGGSAYYYVGTGIGQLIFEMVSNGDPGCYWNHSLGWNRPGAGLLKEEPPGGEEDDLWITYAAPDYIGEMVLPD